MAIEIVRVETYNIQTGEVIVEEREIETQTTEELIQEKQDKLIEIYSELQKLIADIGTQSNI